ncbi:carboxymuconolactone decarboxylase family protein [Jeotgalibacillus sp. S-D1]|uniref:carboxymuconolactone decarboxylase family protein n=1 Tax=Jeotgalibacillus sp. S-D1 TaxID=2552189 RepID=UPI00105A4615|nr:carboxymuconolactone decarboxylase family protein [Jeotgalibacillus sp. S-D1]TDL32480.1 carboxymuconolactone decarboxylase family protein [Jeotgalibacillus sp. S-D1]
MEEHIHDEDVFTLKEAIGELSSKMPNIMKTYHTFTEECFKPGELSQKEKQLIALGVSLATQDEYCVHYHVTGCVDHDITPAQIREVAAVSAAVQAGAVMAQAATEVEWTLNAFEQENAPN